VRRESCLISSIFFVYFRMFASFSRRAAGAFLLVLVCVLWVSSSELTQYIFADLAFSRPYFFTWFATSMFQFYLLGFLVCRPWRQRCYPILTMHLAPLPPTQTHTPHSIQPLTLLFRAVKAIAFEPDDPNSVSLLNPTAQSQYGRRPSLEHPLTSPPRVRHVFPVCHLFRVPMPVLQVASVSEVANISSILFVLWFLANLTFNISLQCTSVAANTVLSSSRHATLPTPPCHSHSPSCSAVQCGRLC
jgi:solute carrier family 35 protein F5